MGWWFSAITQHNHVTLELPNRCNILFHTQSGFSLEQKPIPILTLLDAILLSIVLYQTETAYFSLHIAVDIQYTTSETSECSCEVVAHSSVIDISVTRTHLIQMQTTRVRVSLYKNDLNLMLTLIWPWPWCVTLTLICDLDLFNGLKGTYKGITSWNK